MSKSRSKPDEGFEVKFEDALEANGLDFNRTKEISLINRRAMVKVYADRTEYSPNDEVIFQINTGTLMVAPKNSWLQFELNATDIGDAKIAFNTHDSKTANHGSAVNLIQGCRLTNGEEIFRENQVNLRNYHESAYMLGDSYKLTTGSSFAAGSTDDIKDATPTYAIPLEKLSPFFEQDELINSQLIAGSMLHITLEAAATALVSINGTATYVIKNPVLVLDTHRAGATTEQELKNKSSQQDGLTYEYTTYQSTNSGLGANVGRISANVGKPVSQTLYAFSVMRDSSNINLATVDSFASSAMTVTLPQWSYRLGSQQIPETKVTNNTETFMMAQLAFDKMRMADASPHSVTRTKFDTTNGIIAASYARHHKINLSGVALNVGGRQLHLDLTTSDAATAREITTFMRYYVIARSYLSGQIEVSI